MGHSLEVSLMHACPQKGEGGRKLTFFPHNFRNLFFFSVLPLVFSRMEVLKIFVPV